MGDIYPIISQYKIILTRSKLGDISNGLILGQSPKTIAINDSKVNLHIWKQKYKIGKTGYLLEWFIALKLIC